MEEGTGERGVGGAMQGGLTNTGVYKADMHVRLTDENLRDLWYIQARP